MKKNHIILLVVVSISLLFIFLNRRKAKLEESATEMLIKKRLSVPRIPVNISLLKTSKPKLHFKDSVKEPKIENLVMIGEVGKFGVGGNEGKVLRALRFKNITDSIEDIYNLPPHILLAMVSQESSGVDLLPNGLDDGGFGLCHMQPEVARDFGLKIYANCDEMVCKKHGRALRNILEKNNYDRKTVLKYDDRLQPIYNLDAVARMLTVHSEGSTINGLGHFRTAVCRYAGKYNYRKYWENVKNFIALFEDTKYLKKVENDFNRLNPNLKINGEPADFKKYIEVCQKQNFNYGLTDYCKQQKLLPSNSIEVLRTYRSFL